MNPILLCRKHGGTGRHHICDVCEERRNAITPPKGEPMPRTVEYYQANAIRDQELIMGQKDEISRLKMRINKLEQKHG